MKFKSLVLLLFSIFTYQFSQAQCNANFSYSIDTSTNTVSFFDSSNNRNASHRWTVGNIIKYTTNPKIQFQYSGKYTVCHIVTDSLCSDTVCKTITISGTSSNKCSALFSFSNSKDTFTFAAKNTNYTSYYWYISNGSTSTQKTTSTVFSRSGYYTVCLSVYDSSNNCQDSICKTIYYQGSNSCQASFLTTISNDTVNFTNRSHNGSGFYYYWNFGDNTTSTKQHPIHIYSKPGNYYPCLTIYDSSRSCQSTYCDSVVIKNNNSCDASFTATLDSNNRVKVVAKNKNYTSYYWNFGDGTSSTNQSDTHSYRSAGYKTICLGVYDSTKNCQDSVCKTILINGNNNRKCKAEFRYSASKNTVSFTNASTNTQGSKSGMAYSWSFGDGKSSNTKSPSHTYSKDGIYNVCLSLYDSAGRCQSSYCDSVEIKGSCYSYFEVVLDSSTKYRLKLINKASKKSTHFYRWTFGDGNTSTSRNPSHTYQSFGWYEVCLKVMDTSLKCITTYCDSIGMDSTGKMLKNGAFEIVISDDGKLNVSDNEKLDFSIYPNPVRDVLTLNLAYTKPGHSHYQMIDLLGRVVAESEIISLKSEISVRDLTPGIYWVRVIQGQTVSVKKIIVNR